MERQPSARFRIIDRSQVDDDCEALVVRYCDDCACPTAPQAHVQPKDPRLDLNAMLLRADGLHFEALPDGYWAVCNPVGNGGIIVLDDLTRSLLDSFAAPRNAAMVLTQYNQNKHCIEAISRLIAVELLHTATSQESQPSFLANDQIVAWLHITNQCNFACTYCYVKQSQQKMTPAIGHAAIDAVIKSTLDAGYSTIKIKYAGGEAALALGTVFDVHDYAARSCESQKLNLRATLLSNGVGLLGKDLAALKTRNIGVMISLDGLDDTHDRQRPLRNGKSSVHYVLEAIEALQTAGITPHLSVTVTEQNCTKLHEVVCYALEHGLSFSFNLCRDTETEVGHPQLEYSSERLIAGLSQAFQAIRDHMPRNSVVGTVLDRGHLLAPHTHACGVGQDYIVIDHQGLISKCHMMIDTAVAHVTDDSPLQAIRYSQAGPHNPPVSARKDCQACPWRYFCTGGCPLATYRATGRYDARSPYCSVYQAIYPLAVQLEGLRLLKYCKDV